MASPMAASEATTGLQNVEPRNELDYVSHIANTIGWDPSLAMGDGQKQRIAGATRGWGDLG